MLRARVIPTLLLRNESLVKTVRFGRFTYVGDPANTVRIFNELEVDELLFLDITASRERRGPNVKVLAEIADECFMPLGYGGGIRDVEQAKRIFDIGFEKVVVNTAAIADPGVISEIARPFGSQAVVASIDVKRDFRGRSRVRIPATGRLSKLEPVAWAIELVQRGAGELIVTSVDREGTWTGVDVALTRAIADAVDVPVIAHGGIGSVAHIGQAIREAGASAVAVGSLVVFQKQDMGVLVNFPDPTHLAQHIAGAGAHA